MPKITLEVSDELAQQLTAVGERLPELLRLSLQQSPIPTQIYRYILDFLIGNPTPEQIAAFRPTPAMVERLQNLLSRHKSGNLTPSEQSELDEYESLEHLIVMLKSGNLRYLNPVGGVRKTADPKYATNKSAKTHAGRGLGSC